MTTFLGYGEVPLQRPEIMRGFMRNSTDPGIQDHIAQLEKIASALRSTTR
jgi:hypothetical protein